MPKPDEAHLQTDKELAKLEKRIAKVYKEAADDLQKTVDDYFAKFAKRDAKQRALLEAGEITEQEYKQWRLAQMGRGERFKALQSRVAERYTEANETAVRYVNDATPGIYSLNRNYSAYTIEKAAGNVGFDLWDEQTVKRLIVENPEVMPYYPPEKALNRGIDLAYGKRQISASVTSSILQGKRIPGIAKDLQTRMPDMNKASAVRTARTAVTGAQNAGRMDSYVAAEKMGIKVRKEWLATIDGRTRHSHAMLDGKVVDKDKKFGNGCMFPGDPNGPPWEVYNCRCTLIAAVDGVDTSNAQRRVRNPETGKNELVSDMTYSEWAGWKENAQVQKAMAEKQMEEQEERYNAEKINGQYKKTGYFTYQDYYSESQESFRLEAIKELSGFDDKKSKEVLDAFCGTRKDFLKIEGSPNDAKLGWFYGADTDIRTAKDGKWYTSAKTIDDYIMSAPKYEGKIYRGLAVDKDTLTQFEKGSIFTENGLLSSWTGKSDIAKDFATYNGEQSGKIPVIIESENPQYGTPVAHLSIFGWSEDEVIVSNMRGGEYIIDGVREENGIFFVKLIKKVV